MKVTTLPINLTIIIILLMSVIFVIDLQLPLGVAGGVPYVIVILVSLWFQNKSYVIGLAMICTILVIIGFYASPIGGEAWKVLTNRALAIFVIWSVAILIIKWDITKKKLLLVKHEAEDEKVTAKEEIYMATMHSTLHITNNLLNQLKLVQMEIENHNNFDKETLTLFNDMTLEASTLLTKLSTVKDIDAEKIKQSVMPK